MQDEQGDYPGKKAGDLVHSGASAVLGSVPGVGAAAAEVFNYFLSPPVDKRREEWLNRLKERLDALELELGELVGSDAFVDAVIAATQSAVKTHEEEKLEALRNAVVNTATNTGLAEDRQLMFLRMIDEMTALHFKTLSILDNPKKHLEDKGIPTNTIQGSKFVILQEALGMKKTSDAYNQEDTEHLKQVVRALLDNGLIGSDLGGMVQEVYGPSITKMGKQLLAYISETPSKNDG